jgi:homoserine dehydrogenase
LTEAHRRPTGVGVGMLGIGVVGSGVARVLSEKSGRIADAIGCPVTLHGVLVRDLSKPRSFEVAPDLLTTDPRAIIDDPRVDIVVEVMGGESPALDYILESISAGKHVVTANKEVIARHGPDVLALARTKGVQVLFEASVGGGTPIVAPLLRDLVANEVTAIIGIINGTTNYILTRMAYEGVDFEEALKEAQELGFAESDPTNDVEGIDAAYKLAILSTLAFRARVKDTDVHREGITRLTARDFRYASELGFAIKLMAMARKSNGALQLRVHPVFVPSNQLIAKVDGVLNAVEVETDLAGRVLFHGRGAGAMPTTSAVVADVVEISRGIVNNAMPTAQFSPDSDIAISPIDGLETKYYLRMSVEDRSGVLAQIAKVLGDLNISIDSVLQKGTDEIERRAELVLTTHRASEASMQQALRLLDGLEVVHEVGNMVRVEEWDD